MKNSDLLSLKDNLHDNLSQASSILELLQTNGQDLSSGFTISHQAVLNCIWSVEKILEKSLQTLAEN